MKAFQILFFLTLFNVAFVLLNVTGIFFFNPNPSFHGENEDTYGWSSWTAGDILVLTAIDFTVASFIGIGLSRYGVNPYLTAAYISFMGIFIILYYSFVKVLDGIGNEMGEAKIIMTTFEVILTVIMAILVLYTTIQMAVGGGKGFE